MNITKNRESNCLNKAFKMRRNSDNSRCWMRAISIGLLLQIIANCGKSMVHFCYSTLFCITLYSNILGGGWCSVGIIDVFEKDGGRGE